MSVSLSRVKCCSGPSARTLVLFLLMGQPSLAMVLPGVLPAVARTEERVRRALLPRNSKHDDTSKKPCSDFNGGRPCRTGRTLKPDGTCPLAKFRGGRLKFRGGRLTDGGGGAADGTSFRAHALCLTSGSEYFGHLRRHRHRGLRQT